MERVYARENEHRIHHVWNIGSRLDCTSRHPYRNSVYSWRQHEESRNFFVFNLVIKGHKRNCPSCDSC